MKPKPMYHATRQKPLGVSQGQMKYCPNCKTWSNVYDEQTICPKCNECGLREK